MNGEYFKYGDGRQCEMFLNKYPDYKLYWQSGWGFKGKREMEIDRNSPSFSDEMKNRYNWAANITITVNHEDKSLHFNGLSLSDME